MTARDADVTYAFRCGADMNPTLIRRASPEARFVARACLTDGRAPFQVAAGDDSGVWGILLTLPEAGTSQPSGTVETDDGQTFRAVMLTEAGDVADRVALIAAARYWELPPDYIRRLGGVEEEVTA